VQLVLPQPAAGEQPNGQTAQMQQMQQMLQSLFGGELQAQVQAGVQGSTFQLLSGGAGGGFTLAPTGQATPLALSAGGQAGSAVSAAGRGIAGRGAAAGRAAAEPVKPVPLVLGQRVSARLSSAGEANGSVRRDRG
jgi:hypothetical protein